MAQYPESLLTSSAGELRTGGWVPVGSSKYPQTEAAGAIVSHTVYSLAATVNISRFPQRRQIGHCEARFLSPPQTLSTARAGRAYVQR